MVRLMQQERLKSPRKSPILENQTIWVIFGHFGPNGHFHKETYQIRICFPYVINGQLFALFLDP